MADEDDGGFGVLYVSSRLRLGAQIFGLTGDPAESAEIVQEAFARAWSNWRTVRPLDDPEAWVRKVAFRLAVSRWRRLQRLVPLGAIRAESLSVEPVSERLDVVRALIELPARQRQAVVLHYLAGLSVDEIASEMGVPAGTVKSWLSRARQKLALRLGEDGRSVEQEVGQG